MTVANLVFYEIWTRFKLFNTWRALILGVTIGLGWTGWQVGKIASSSYVAFASLFDEATPNAPQAPSAAPIVRSNESARGNWYYNDMMEGFHEGGWPILAKATPDWARDIRVQDAYECDSPDCYRVIVVFRPGDDFSPPAYEKIDAAFADYSFTKEPLMLYAHTPFQRHGDLIRYELPRFLWYGQVMDSGYSPYDNEYPEAVHSHMKLFMEREIGRARAIDCYYEHPERNRIWHYTFWFKERPFGADVATLKSRFSNHPLLEFRDPVNACPLSKPDS